MPEERPRLSVVLAARNADDAALEDVIRTMRAWADAANSFKAPIEILLVDWNRPRERPSLHKALRTSPLPVVTRIIEVPVELHQSLTQGDDYPLAEHRAWNAGIRRAQGDFVLVTRPGSVPNPGLAEFVLTGDLDSGTLYRTDVYETEAGDFSPEEALDHVCRIYRSRETLDLKNGTAQLVFRRTFEIWGEPFVELLPRLISHFLLILHEVLKGVRSGQWTQLRLLLKIGTVWRRDVSRVWYLFTLRRSTRLFFTPYHVNAAGDFLLASRDGWFSAHGLPEYEGPDVLVDAMFVMAALFSGRLKEHVLSWPMCLLRICKAATVAPSPSGKRLTPFEAAKLADQFAVNRNSPFNGDDWGLGGLALMEWVAGR
jgi:hypothetical protein